MGELCGKFTISNIWFHVNFFPVGLDNALRIREKKRVVYLEMAPGEAKSNVAKWNLISGTQIKQLKNCLMFMYFNDSVCSDWTLDVVFIVHDGM